MTLPTGRLFALSDNQNGMVARPDPWDLDDIGLLRGDILPKEPVLFRRHLGNVPRDLVMGASVNLLLISEHVRSILANGHFTGWSTYPVRLLGPRDVELVGYCGLAITGRSKRDVARASDAIEDRVWRLRSDADLYLDGSSSLIVVNRVVAEALRGAKVSNLHLVPVA